MKIRERSSSVQVGPRRIESLGSGLGFGMHGQNTAQAAFDRAVIKVGVNPEALKRMRAIQEVRTTMPEEPSEPSA